MNLLLRVGQWGEDHHPRWMDIIRIALGLFLIYKGVDFLVNMGRLNSMLEFSGQKFGGFVYLLAGHYVVFAHIIGGLGLVVGMFTRVACIIQIPILLGAVLFVNSNPQLLQPYSEKILSVIILLLLFYFLIAGNGPLSYKLPAERPHGQ